ncbi:MAG: diacylglycerol kinase family protein [Bacteroidia bacterium]|nr:diacylglycerol kinase family protein [Bacteroidia bacterium]
MSYLKNRKNAFVYAFSGLWQVTKREAHIRIHLLATVLVVSAGFYFGLSSVEWVCICACIALVFCLEIINTAIEKLCDLVMPDQHPTIKYIKDISAAAVLIACGFAVVTGLIIFLPYLLKH